MRIRKNSKFSTLMLAQGSSSPYPAEAFFIRAHDCKLNQSPWDVITFPPDSTATTTTTTTTTSSFPTQNRQQQQQLEGEHSFTENVSIGDSVGAVESVASMKISSMEGEAAKAMKEDCGLVVPNVTEMEEKKREKEVVDNGEKRENNGIGLRKGESVITCCNKADGKGWQCRREAKEGHSLCDHHLAQLRSYNSVTHTASRKSEKPPTVAKVVGVRRRGRGANKGSTSNPYEFYYYSGFGPRWGKKRGGGKGEEASKSDTKVVDAEAINETPTPSSSSQIDNSNDNEEEDFDLVDDDDEDEADENGDENGCDRGRKRARKPVKARSLKSLM